MGFTLYAAMVWLVAFIECILLVFFCKTKNVNVGRLLNGIWDNKKDFYQLEIDINDNVEFFFPVITSTGDENTLHNMVNNSHKISRLM